MSNSPITSVSPQTAFPRPNGEALGDYLPSSFNLNVRGRRFILDRETINHLPDSLLGTMFPNGLLSLVRGYGYGYSGDSNNEQIWVDFDPDMLEYILSVYSDTLEYDLLMARSNSRNIQGSSPSGVASDVDANVDTDTNSRSSSKNNSSRSSDDANGNNGGNVGDTNAQVWQDYMSKGAAADGGDGNSSGNSDANNASSSSPQAQSNDASGQEADAYSPDAGSAPTSVPNDSMSTFTDTGSRVNSSSVATHSTSSSAVLNYMRFVSGMASQGAGTAGSGGNGSSGGESHISSTNSGTPEGLDEGGAVYSNHNPLVVLREELDYFVVPSSGKTKGDISNVPGFTLAMAKTRCGELLVEDDSVFEPLERTMQRNLEKWRNKVNTEGPSDQAQALQSASVIEQQLIDMLCLAGFPRDARWGCRRIEPTRTSVTSILTVPLCETTDQARTMAAQKLVLFYKKPARKCWWEGEDVNAGDTDHKIELKLWCRRTWTLELVMI